MAKNLFSGNIAVIGEREIILGFRLIGIEDSFIVDEEKGAEKVMDVYKSGKYSVIMISQNLRKKMDVKLLSKLESSTKPVVVFIPLPGSEEEESIAQLAKRVLGVDIGR